MPRNQSLMKTDNIAADQKTRTWIPLCEIAKGDVGVVFKVRDLEGKILAAMKVEIIRKGLKKKHIEKDILEALRDSPHSLHLIDHSYVNHTRVTVMTLAGPTLGTIKALMKNKFSDSTILRLAIRTLLALKDLHDHGYVHRDLEPENIALSYCKSSRSVFLLDFGEARQYARIENGKWILRPARKRIDFRGSNQYCSLKMHNNEDISRIDDIWSWLYIFMEMRVFLPWTDSTFQCKYAPRKRTLLDETLDSDPFLTIFHPIVKIMNTSKYEDRPEYFKIYEILADKMKQIGVKWEDPMDYDAITERQSFFSTTPMNEEKMTEDQVVAVFQEVVVPGGMQHVHPFNTESEREKEKEVKSEKKKVELEKEKIKEKDDKDKEKEKEVEKKKEKVVEKPKEKEKEKIKPKETKKSREMIKEKDKKIGSQEKTTDKSTDAPSKNVVEKKQPKTATTKPAVILTKKGTKTSSTSSVSHQTPPSVAEKPPSSIPLPTPTRPMRKKPAITPAKHKAKT